MPKNFNLAQVIEAYNKSKKKRVPLDKTWGFDCFATESLGLLNQANRLLDFHLTPPIAIDQARAVHMRYKEGKIGLLYGERLKWEQKLHKYLSDKRSWIHWESEVTAQNPARKSRIKALNDLWQFPLLHFHSNEDLVRIALFQRVAEIHIKIARKEFNRKYHRLPTDIARKYHAYLSQLEKRFSDAKEQVAQTMFMRLLAASESSVKTGQLHGDILNYTVDKLADENIDLKRPTLSGHRHAFTANTFTAFHQILQEQNNRLYQHRKQKLAWFREDGLCPTVTRKISRQICIVPKALAKDVPSWKGWPKWLFRDRHARADFIVDQQFAIAQLKIPLPELPKVINPETQKQFLVNLVEQEKRCQAALTSIQSQKVSRGQSGFRKMLEDWRNLHRERLHKCAVKRIAFLQAVSQQTTPEYPMISLKQWRDLRPIMESLERRVLPAHLKRSFSDVYRKLQAQCGQTPLLYAEGLFEQLADGKRLKLADRQYLLEILGTLDCGEQNLNDVVSPETASLAAKHLFAILKLQLRQDNLNFVEIQVNGQLLKRVGDLQAQQEFQALLEKRVLRHFNFLVKLPEGKAKVQAEKLEVLMLQLGDSTLTDRFQALKALRVQSWSGYLAAYRQIAAKLAVTYTDQRAELEAEKVEAYFTRQVQAVITDSAEREMLSTLPQRLVAQQTKQLASVFLMPYEKILTGLQGSNNRQGIKKAIEVTAASRLALTQVKQAKTLAEKQKLLDQLKFEITNRLPELTFFQKRYPVSNIPVNLEDKYVVRPTV